MNDFLTPVEIASRYPISQATLYRWAQQQRVRTSGEGSRLRLAVDDVVAAMRDRTPDWRRDSAAGDIPPASPAQARPATAAAVEQRDRALALVERRARRLQPHQLDALDAMLRGRTAIDPEFIADRILVTENPVYRRLFRRALTSPELSTPTSTEERLALDRYREHEARALSDGVTTAGGYGVPVFIDPTIIPSSGAGAAPIAAVARVTPISTNVWRGVVSAPPAFSYTAEGSTSADATPTLGQPTIPVYTGRSFVPYSVELGQDYGAENGSDAFEAEFAAAFEEGLADLLAQKTAVGSGVNEPTGIFTRMANTTPPNHVTLTTAGTLGAVDLRRVWEALPERFRRRPGTRWVMSQTFEDQVRALGNNLQTQDLGVAFNILPDGSSVLMGRPVIVTDYAPAWTGTAGAASLAVVGDFSHFRVIVRAGMTVEVIPSVPDPATGRPSGLRGLFAYARHGFDVDTPNAFRLLTNT